MSVRVGGESDPGRKEYLSGLERVRIRSAIERTHYFDSFCPTYKRNSISVMPVRQMATQLRHHHLARSPKLCRLSGLHYSGRVLDTDGAYKTAFKTMVNLASIQLNPEY